MRDGLKESGYEVGRNVAIEYHWADERRDRLLMLVAELIRRPVAVIVCNGVAALPVKAATATVPIVFVTGSDPVRDGLGGKLQSAWRQRYRHQLRFRRERGKAAGAAATTRPRRGNDRRADRPAHERRRGGTARPGNCGAKPSGSSFSLSKSQPIATSGRRLPQWSSAKSERC